MVSTLASINEVNLRRARLVLRWATVYGFNSRCRTSILVCNQPATIGQLSLHPSGVGKWVPASAGKAKAGMIHSVSGWTRGVQVKLWEHLRTRAIPERLRGVFTTRRYTNPCLPLTLPLLWCCNFVYQWRRGPWLFYPSFRVFGRDSDSCAIGGVSYLIYLSMRHYVLTTSGDIVVCFYIRQCVWVVNLLITQWRFQFVIGRIIPKGKLSYPGSRKRRGGWPGFEVFVWRRLTSSWILSAMSPEIQEWSLKSRSRINNLYLLTRPIVVSHIKGRSIVIVACRVCPLIPETANHACCCS